MRTFSPYKLRATLEDYWTLISSLVVFVIVVVVVLLFYVRLNVAIKDNTLLAEEVALLKERYDTLNRNKSLTVDQIATYNRVLSSLIPEVEDYFSIIYALDEISNKSKFVISEYAIAINRSSGERLALNVEGRGNADAFLKFLETYQFSGGRLATSNKIQFSGSGFTTTKINLNFYSKRFQFKESVGSVSLEEQDIARLRTIQDKITIEYLPGETPEPDTNYATKVDPFIVE